LDVDVEVEADKDNHQEVQQEAAEEVLVLKALDVLLK
jgi:hypothetical protein